MLTTFLSSQLRTYVHISVTSVDQVPFEEFIRSISSLTVLNIYSMAPLKGNLIMEINPNIAYALLDRILGGKGAAVTKTDNLTEIEILLLKQIFEKASGNLKESWSSLIDVEPVLEEFEENPQFIQMVAPNDTVVIVSLSTAIGESTGMINLCIPHTLLEPIIPKLSAHYWMENAAEERDEVSYAKLTSSLQTAEVNLTALLGETEISINEFLGLGKNDILALNQPIDDPLLLKINDETKFYVQPGEHKKKKAVQVLEEITKGRAPMNDGMLSQDEIDALLNVSPDKDENADAASNEEEVELLTDIEIDTIGEIGNISFGSSATTLSTLLRQKVEITTPTVNVIKQEDIKDEFTFEPVSIQVDYTQGFSGRNVFVIRAEDAAIIADIMLGGDGTNPDETLPEIYISAVQEAMNQMMGTAATSMSSVFDKKVDISPPSVIEGSIEKDAKEIFNEAVYVKVFFRLIVGDLIDSNMMQLIPLSFAKELVGNLLNNDQEPAATVEAPVLERENQETANNAPVPANRDGGRNPNPAGQPEEKQTQYLGNNFDYNSASIEKASFSNFEQPALSSTEQRNLDMLLDISLKVTVELGRTKKSIKDILDLSAGSIVELDKLAGEPVDILVNDKLIAEGEVIVIDENFGVRVTDIISQSDRLMKLK